jgi:hypothetical protein
VEINRLRLNALIAATAVCMLLSGCGVSNALDGRDAEIIRLKYELLAQEGTRAAQMAYAERQVGIYRGCTLLFNLCSKEITQEAQELIKQGFTGDSSPWWWLPFLAKLVCLGGFLGALLWLPLHLFFKYTGPAKKKVDDANALIAGKNEAINAANRKKTQTEQETSAMRRELKSLKLDVIARKKVLTATEEAIAVARATLVAAKSELAEVSRLRESFKRF